MQSEGFLPSYLLFTFLIQQSPGFQILHKFRFIISIHCINKVFEIEEKNAQKKCFTGKKQKTSSNLPSSVTTFISYGMNWPQASLILLTPLKSVGDVGHSEFDACGRRSQSKISATLSKIERAIPGALFWLTLLPVFPNSTYILLLLRSRFSASKVA